MTQDQPKYINISQFDLDIIVQVTHDTRKYRLTHSERRPKNIYSQEEMNLYCIIKLAT